MPSKAKHLDNSNNDADALAFAGVNAAALPISGDWLRQRANATPDQTALVYRDAALKTVTWDYRTLDQLVDALAANLSAVTQTMQAQKRPPHVAVLLPNGPEYVLLVHALARLQNVLVPLNTRLTASEIAWQIQQADCSLLVYAAAAPATQTVARQAAALAGASALRLLDIAEVCYLPKPEYPGVENSPRSPGHLQAIVFTSGTTGKPKGAQISFANHFYGAVASAFCLGAGPDDRWLVTLPFFHIGGLAIIFRSCLYGSAMILQDQSGKPFDPAVVLRALQEPAHSPAHTTLISLVPTMLHRLLELPGGAEALFQLRYILLGGAAAPLRLLERALSAGLNIAATYGMTETTSQFATASPQQTRRKPGSVGRPLLFSQARILSENGAEMPPGAIGQIAVCGPTVTSGYYRVDAPHGAPSEFLTGDLGYLDADGDLWVVQRRVDLIVSGGENVYPAEVEQALLAHPQVENACVVGRDHPEWGQQVVAAVTLRPGTPPDADELLALCRQRLAGYKVPRQIYFFEHLPQTETGKILRQKVFEAINASRNL